MDRNELAGLMEKCRESPLDFGVLDPLCDFLQENEQEKWYGMTLGEHREYYNYFRLRKYRVFKPLFYASVIAVFRKDEVVFEYGVRIFTKGFMIGNIGWPKETDWYWKLPSYGVEDVFLKFRAILSLQQLKVNEFATA